MLISHAPFARDNIKLSWYGIRKTLFFPIELALRLQPISEINLSRCTNNFQDVVLLPSTFVMNLMSF